MAETHTAAKPRLLIEETAPDRTVSAVREILRQNGGLFERGVPVSLAYDQVQRGTVAQPLTPDGLVRHTHSVCRPYLRKLKDGATIEVDARLPRAMATMFLDWRGSWGLLPLNGITSSPLLRDCGEICCSEGYDPKSGMWVESVPDVAGLVSERPTAADARAALQLLRDTFRTFCFADAIMIANSADGGTVVDTTQPPGRDESAFLAALVTAICRASLPLAPAILFRAPPLSGAGAGKGLLARCIIITAFGREPHAVTSGGSADELEKRIAAELIAGGPALFLDNLNNVAFKSDLLASVITERPARVRLLGKSRMLPLNSSALITLTGNGLTISEDLARRFLTVEMDPHMEDPEARSFATDIRADVTRRRVELLAASLTIWRWGRRGGANKRGKPLGSFELWCEWVRDPLLTLGCKDPVERISEAKERDGRRQAIAELFLIWWERHADGPVAASDLHDDVRQAADPQGRGRQYLVSHLEKLAGTRMAGFVLTRQAPAGKWGAATYQLSKTDAAGNGDGHRGHRPHRPTHAPYAPYADEDHRNGQTIITDSVAPEGATPIEIEEGRL